MIRTLAFVFLAAAASAQGELVADPILAGLEAPVAVLAPSRDGRLFVVEQGGRVRVAKDERLLAEPFLDLSDEVAMGPQIGLLGFAFHPGYAQNGYVFAYYTTDPDSAVVVRYEVSADDPDRIDPDSAFEVLAPFGAPGGFHQGGGMAFDENAMLLVAVGDQRDLPGASCAAQGGDSLLGKILRLRADGKIPQTNPFVGDPSFRDEIWAYGLRQPYRIFFDAVTEELYVGDVGESDREEIIVQRTQDGGGENYGWRVVEGTLCTGSEQCASLPCPDGTYVAPTHEYGHDVGCCVVAGAVYRGTAIPWLVDAFVYGDTCGAQVFALRQTGGTVESVTPLAVEGEIQQLVGFGLDELGELLVVDRGFGQPGQGVVSRLRAKSAFASVGAGVAGSEGVPALLGAGDLLPGTTVTLELRKARADAPATLVGGFSQLDLPFKGGVLVPAPDAVVPGLVTDAAGTIELVATWPDGLAPDAVLSFQFWIEDRAGPQGFSASNGLQIAAP